MLGRTPQTQITYPADEMVPADVVKPPIGTWLDMPDTNSEVEYTQILTGEGGDRHNYPASRPSFDPFGLYYFTRTDVYDLPALLNNNTVTVLDTMPGWDGFENVVSNLTPGRWFGIDGGEFGYWDIGDNGMTSIVNIPGSNVRMGKTEGGISEDDRYAIVNYESGGDDYVAVVDIAAGTIVGTLNTNGIGNSNENNTFNSAQISRSGDYVAVSLGDRTFLYDTPGFTNKQQLSGTTGGSSWNFNGSAHKVWMYDAAGNEIFVMEGNSNPASSNIHRGKIAYVHANNIANYYSLDLIDYTNVPAPSGRDSTYASAGAHLSAAYAVDGLLMVSLSQRFSGMKNMFCVSLEPNQTTVSTVGYHMSEGNAYPDEAHASISYDGKLVMYTSDFDETGRTEVIARLAEDIDPQIITIDSTGCPEADVTVGDAVSFESNRPTGVSWSAGPFWVGNNTLNNSPYTAVDDPNGGTYSFNPVISAPGDYVFTFSALGSDGNTYISECAFTAVASADECSINVEFGTGANAGTICIENTGTIPTTVTPTVSGTFTGLDTPLAVGETRYIPKPADVAVSDGEKTYCFECE